MDVLRAVFPHIPEDQLQSVLEMCDNSAQRASSWLIDNDWRDLLREIVSETGPAAPQPTTAAGTGLEDDDSEDSAYEYVHEEDEDEEVEEEDVGADYRVNVDELVQIETDSDNEMLLLRPRKKTRTRIGPSIDESSNGARRYWVRFDDAVMLKTHIELLNIILKKCAHHSVSLLNANADLISRDEAIDRFMEYSGPCKCRFGANKEKENSSSSSSGPYSATDAVHSINHTKKSSCKEGYWAHFFDIDDVDEVWRSACSAHLFGQRKIGTVFEIRSCTPEPDMPPDKFDMISSYSKSRRSCSVCLVVPCENEVSAIQAVGVEIVKMLLLKECIYYRHTDPKDAIQAAINAPPNVHSLDRKAKTIMFSQVSINCLVSTNQINNKLNDTVGVRSDFAHRITTTRTTTFSYIAWKV
eukprot:CAMPEP_0203751244 /NCGR_PEP_ID=MMETSP0098-20131031/5345_1 /ASSEMBLY_ACC=CAM_ASM_000208 /TAXON_ID=96639 /ORGANISM=" , Strain NY0313808BC1" /LENGTH=411 /DNA_ID=CAMNT_0050640871 /DNA_START=471 /DNA_END=1707 /DNA_ORIENTATION=+